MGAFDERLAAARAAEVAVAAASRAEEQAARSDQDQNGYAVSTATLGVRLIR